MAVGFQTQWLDFKIHFLEDTRASPYLQIRHITTFSSDAIDMIAKRTSEYS